MLNVLKKTLLVVITLLLIDQLVGRTLMWINEGTMKGDYGRNTYIATQAAHDILIFGSSRAIHHYDPSLISEALGMSCYNCGEDGMGIILMYARLQMILQRHTPKVVIYDIEPSYDLLEDDNTRYLGFLRPFYDNDTIKRICVDVSPSERFKNLSMLYRFNSRWVDIIAQRISRDPSQARDYTWAPLHGRLNAEPPKNDNTTSKHYDSLKLKYLRQLVSCCSIKDIKLFFVVSPRHGNTQDTIIAPLKKLADAYSLPLFNHFTDTAYTNHAEFFSDRDHLNEIGSRQLTTTIINEINLIGINAHKGMTKDGQNLQLNNRSSSHQCADGHL